MCVFFSRHYIFFRGFFLWVKSMIDGTLILSFWDILDFFWRRSCLCLANLERHHKNQPTIFFLVSKHYKHVPPENKKGNPKRRFGSDEFPFHFGVISRFVFGGVTVHGPSSCNFARWIRIRFLAPPESSSLSSE